MSLYRDVPLPLNEAHKDVILKAFAGIGINVERIIKARLADGWYLYYDGAPQSALKHYRYTVVERGYGYTKKLRERVNVFHDFISDYDEDDFNDSLRMHIQEAKNRLGVKP